MVNELASSMCKPLIAFMKEMKGDSSTLMGASKLQRLVTEIDSKISLEVQTLRTANNEYKTQVKNIDFKLQACNKELEKMSLDGKTMHRSLQEKVEEVEALKIELAVEAAEKQSYKSRLDSEIARACRLEEEVKQSKAKLADVLKLLQATKLRLAHENSQIQDAYTESKKLCDKLYNVKNRSSQTMAAITSFFQGDVDVTKGSDYLVHVHQPDDVCSKGDLLEGNEQNCWHLWRKACQLLSTEMVEMQSGCPNKVLLQEAVIFLSKLSDNQKPLGVQKEETLLNSHFLQEQQMMNGINWLEKIGDIQELQHNLFQKAQHTITTDLMPLKNEILTKEEVNDSTDSDIADTGGVTLGFWIPMFFLLAHWRRPNQGTDSVLAWSDICSQGLKDFVSELFLGIPGVSKPSNILCQVLAAVGLTTILKTEFGVSQAGSSCDKFGSLPQQQPKQQRSDMIQNDSHEIKLLKYESSSQLHSEPSLQASLSQEVCGSKRKSSNSNIEEQNYGINLLQLSGNLVQLSRKKLHICTEAEDTRLQTEKCPSRDLVDEHQTMKSKNGSVTTEGQNTDGGSLSILVPTQNAISMRGESTNIVKHHVSSLAKEDKAEVKYYSTPAAVDGNKGSNSYSATLLAANEEKESPNRSATELWQVLELGTDINSKDTKTCGENGKPSALDLCLANSRGNRQHSAEPLLVLRDDVKRLPRAIGKRASPRLLYRRLTGSTYSCHR